MHMHTQMQVNEQIATLSTLKMEPKNLVCDGNTLFILNLSTPLSSVSLLIWEALPNDLNEIVHAAWNLNTSPIKL